MRAAAAVQGESLRTIERLQSTLGEVLRGKPEVVRLALVALLARGHLLIEDVPGVGKTTLAAALARATGARFARIQFTSDLLPSDVVGVSILDPRTRRFEFRAGPLFANVVLADEINRATPKTQSALLEAMSEQRVTVDGVTRALPDPFFVVATQNPLEHHGTFPLPDSQLDRFMVRTRVGYPAPEEEREILAEERHRRREEAVEPVTRPEELVEIQRAAERVRVDTSLLDYIVSLARASRRLPGIAVGVSPRGSLALVRAAKALALIEGRDFVIPDDIQSLAVPVLAHRLVPAAADRFDTREEAEAAVWELVRSVPVPR
ncbi:MAG: MoxR family ATPase [Acidobacteria bacterium]|nr:MAG: MoxR family ATPase [Acidobacteriota bacterium]